MQRYTVWRLVTRGNHCNTLRKSSKFSNIFLKLASVKKSNQLSLMQLTLKELWNCILCILHAWSLFFSIQIYTSLHFLRNLWKKLVFVFLCSIFFIYSVSFEFDEILLDFTHNTQMQPPRGALKKRCSENMQ